MTKHSADFGQRTIAKVQQLIGELRNRRVIRTVGGYVALIWLLSQGFSDLFPVFGLPDWSLRAFIAVSIMAIPLVALLSWKYDVTPTGLVADQGNSAGSRDRSRRIPTASTAYDQKTVKSGSAHNYIAVTWQDGVGDRHTRNFVHSFVIGRDADVDVRLDDPRVSRHHVKVCNLDGEWYAQDMNSSNGTFCDGEQIQTMDIVNRCRLRLAPDGPLFDVRLLPLDGAVDPVSRQPDVAAVPGPDA